MLRIRQIKHLLSVLGTSHAEIDKLIASPEGFYEELILRDPLKPDKLRSVVNVVGLMRRCQYRFYRRVLLPKLIPSAYSHGGVPLRSIKTNALPHLESHFVFKTDISNFYPSVHYKRIYQLFVGRLQCSPDVAHIATKITTYKHHLALGLITSPILANEVLRTVDDRIGGACSKAGLVYTRYVDDITISGLFDLDRSGVPSLIERILRQHGFRLNPAKHKFGEFAKGLAITNLRSVNSHLDVREEYLTELVRQLEDAASLSRNDEFEGPYYTAGQILGRVRFVCWVNPGRKRELIRRYRSVDWGAARRIATIRGYEISRKTLTKLATVRNNETRELDADIADLN
jgi:RNA-directed DNA polymerase